MPYQWTQHDHQQTLELWPYRSLPKVGFVIVILIAVGLLTIPLFAILGTVALWGILPFMVMAVSALWIALQKSYRDAEILETLVIDDTTVHLTHLRARAPAKEWHCNRYWVRVNRYDTIGPVPQYITLSGNGREVEIGAFLSESERQQLYHDLQRAIATAA